MQVYNYRVKVIDPKKKDNFTVHEVHLFHGLFSCVMETKLMEEFQDQTISFNVGYFEGHQSTKRCICLQEDLEAMYKVYASKTEILLWCDSQRHCQHQ